MSARKCRSNASIYCDQGVKCQLCIDFDSLADALAYFVLMFSETPPDELATQVAEDPSTITGCLDRACAALGAVGRLPGRLP